MFVDNKRSMDSNAFWVVIRIIQRSGCSPCLFLKGLVWRILERILDLLPLVITFFWLSNMLFRKESNDDMATSISYLVGVLVIIFLFQLLAAWRGQRDSFLGGYRIMAGYRKQLLDHIHQLPLGVISDYRAGQLADMMTDDVQRIENIFTHLVVELLTSLFVPLVLFIVLLWVNWALTLGLVAGFPVAVLFVQLSRTFFIRVSQDKQNALRLTSGMIVEYVSGLLTLRLFNKTDVWLKALYTQFSRITRTSVGVELWGAGPVVFYRLFTEFGLAIFLFLVSIQIAEGELVKDPAVLIFILLFVLLAYRLLGPLLEVAEHLSILRFTVQSETKLQQLYACQPLPEPMLREIPQGNSIVVHNVSFGYNHDNPVLDKLNFTVPENSMTAIVGPSGSGKSTLMNLLARFYDPQEGEVRLGGCDYRALGSELLYQKISMVFQQTQLFDGTVMENIKIGCPDATEQQVQDVCRVAYCDDFISQLSDGYNTLIGEGGACLSGGERQRLSIARALLKDASILLLDEATASVDAEAQYHIQNGLSCLIKGRTVVMIAHRLSTIRHASQILVLDEGRLVQKGTHDELVSCKGMYQALWKAQENGD